MIKKLISTSIGIIMIISLVTACSTANKSSDVYINEEISSTMKTVTGIEFDFDENFNMSTDSVISNCVYELESGYGVFFSEDIINFMQDKMIGFMPISKQGVVALYYDLDLENDEFYPSEEDMVGVFMFLKENKNAKSEVDANLFDKHLIHSSNEYDYNYYVLKDISAFEMSDEAKTVVTELLTYSEELKDNAFIFPVQKASVGGSGADNSVNGTSFGEFTGKTIDGEAISNEIFADYDLTMVNLWATWCKPCVNEMAELAELHKALPENLNMISIGHDADTESELAKQILETKGAEFDTVVADDNMRGTLLKDYMTFPTTIFVDKDGNIVGDLMLGAPPTNVVETYMAQMNSRLDSMGK